MIIARIWSTDKFSLCEHSLLLRKP